MLKNQKKQKQIRKLKDYYNGHHFLKEGVWCGDRANGLCPSICQAPPPYNDKVR